MSNSQEQERQELIMTLAMRTNYSLEFLESQPYEILFEMLRDREEGDRLF